MAQSSLAAIGTQFAKVKAIENLFDAVARYGVGVLMSSLGPAAAQWSVQTSMRFDRKISFGGWLTWLNEAATLAARAAAPRFIGELADLFAGESETLRVMLQFKEEVRDPQVGHGHVKEEGWYALINQRYQKVAEKLLRALQFTSRYIIFVPEDVDIRDDAFDYRLRTLMGAETVFPMVDVRSIQRWSRGEVFVRSPDGDSLSLAPFAQYRVCERCTSGRLLWPDAIEAKAIVYKSFCDHPWRDGAARRLFHERFGL